MPGHPDVEKGHVGAVLGDQLQRLAAVSRLGHDLHAGGLQQRADPPADQGMVVGQQDPDLGS